MGRSEQAWQALGSAPVVMVPVGYLVGGLAALPFLAAQTLSLPGATVAVAYVTVLLVVTGITHLDGLADLGDAAVVHGTAVRRREVMTDTQIGVGGTVAVGFDLVGLALAGVALGGLPGHAALGIVVVAEVGAKLAIVVLAALGEAAHRGMGEHLTGAGLGTAGAGVVFALPAIGLGWPTAAGAIGLVAALCTALAVLAWATSRLDGVTGDVFGATNELARLVALHAGVVAWTLS